jgi:SsrA-binding protein
MAQSSSRDERKTIATNRKAFRDYFIMDRMEAGIVLLGTEVKSLREGKAALTDSYASVSDGEVLLHNLHIAPYESGNRFNHEPKRTRKLLLHKKEIRRIYGRITEKGLTVVPLSIYFRRGKVKVELAIARGKRMYDKREALAKEAAKREMEREMRNR